MICFTSHSSLTLLPAPTFAHFSSNNETSNTCHWSVALRISPPLATSVAVRNVSDHLFQLNISVRLKNLCMAYYSICITESFYPSPSPTPIVSMILVNHVVDYGLNSRNNHTYPPNCNVPMLKWKNHIGSMIVEWRC